MVLASFLVPNKNNSAAITVLKFPGQTGGLLQNVNRWLQQLELEPIQLSQLNQYVQNGKTSNYTFQHVTITNTNIQKGMIVFIIRDKNYSWFFKMFGDLEVVVSEKSNFTNFINSVKLP